MIFTESKLIKKLIIPFDIFILNPHLIHIFSGKKRFVTFVVQPNRQRTALDTFAPIASIAAATLRIIGHTMIVCILSTQQRSSRRTTNRRRSKLYICKYNLLNNTTIYCNRPQTYCIGKSSTFIGNQLFRQIHWHLKVENTNIKSIIAHTKKTPPYQSIQHNVLVIGQND